MFQRGFGTFTSGLLDRKEILKISIPWYEFENYGFKIAAAVFTKCFIRSSDNMSDDFEKIFIHFEKIIKHLRSNIQEKFFIWSDNVSDDFEQIIRLFAISSAMSDGPMAVREHCNCVSKGPKSQRCVLLFSFMANDQHYSDGLLHWNYVFLVLTHQLHDIHYCSSVVFGMIIHLDWQLMGFILPNLEILILNDFRFFF